MGSLLKMVKDNTKIRQNRNKAPNRSKLKCFIIVVKRSGANNPRFIEISEQTPQLPNNADLQTETTASRELEVC